MRSGAIFDVTGIYRYSLWRTWSPDHPSIAFVMLNPSTADAERDDPTIKRCIQFARSWGFGSLEVVNLFAYRATYTDDLLKADDPVGAENDWYLVQAVQRATIVVAAWGTKGMLRQRNRQVLQLLSPERDVRCLGRTKEGHPRHPLYVRGDAGLVAFQNVNYSANETAR